MSKIVWICLIPLSLLLPLSDPADAFPRYSNNRDATFCRGCHGDFRSAAYTSRKDGENWGDLHNLHRLTMLSGDCNTCHTGTSATRFPVFMRSSNGGADLAPISCLGCHGRAEDAGHDGTRSAGLGAGLRQHHVNAGVMLCMNCHPDANPQNYTPVAESVAPLYYFAPDPAHPNKPTNACNPSYSEENYAGSIFGLDNDGDGLYDVVDNDCQPPFGMAQVCHSVAPSAAQGSRPHAEAANPHTIWVNGASLAAHLRHGDSLGECK